jgi:hypothetical protein
MSSTTTYVVRRAKREDCAEIARLIQELSDYEQLPDAPKIDPKGDYHISRLQLLEIAISGNS